MEMITKSFTKSEEIMVAAALKVLRGQIVSGAQRGTRRERLEWIHDIDSALTKIDVTR